MRKELRKMDGQRTRFRATVERFGSKTNYHGYPEPTILFKDVYHIESQELACDHIWFTVGKTIAALGLTSGDTVEFDARVGSYMKGYVNYRKGIDESTLDYKLNRPTNFKKVESITEKSKCSMI